MNDVIQGRGRSDQTQDTKFHERNGLNKESKGRKDHVWLTNLHISQQQQE